MALISGPDIKNIIVSFLDGQIVLYLLQWTSPKISIQTVSVSYKLQPSGPIIVASSELPISPSGVPVDSPFLVVADPQVGGTYEVTVKNIDSSYSTTTTISVPYENYSNNYLIGDSVYEVCNSNPVLLFSKQPFDIAVQLFYDIEMTQPIDESYVSQFVYGNIYEVSGGVVGNKTGVSCYNGFAGLYVLGLTDSLCDEAASYGYVDALNPSSLTGLILYSDPYLETPVTGYNYVMDGETFSIYEINSVTGEIGYIVGACDDYYNVIVENDNARRTINSVTGIDGFVLDQIVDTGGTSVGIHVAFTAGIGITIGGGGNCDSCGVDSASLYKNDMDTPIETIDVQEGSYNFSLVTFAATDIIKIVLHEDHFDSLPLTVT